MTSQQHEKAIKKLKTINKFTLTGKTKKLSKDHYLTEYKHQFVQLDDMTLIISGSIENFYSMDHTKESIFLLMSLHDENHEEVKWSKQQHAEFKSTLKQILTCQ